jgi:lactaldehyde reductase
MEYNAPCTGEKYRKIARAMGVSGVDAMTQDEYRRAACEAVRKLAADVGIECTLKGVVKEEDIPALAKDAYADACRPGHPRDTSVEAISALFRSLL